MIERDVIERAGLRLDVFLPYQLSVLNNRVSAALAAQYTEQFALSPAEWRVMAALGGGEGLSASEVAARTAMDKVQVSRAVASLVDAGRILRKTDEEDGRVSRLALSPEGRVIYDEIVPRALELEARLVSVLSEAERGALDRMLGKLAERALNL